MAFRLNNSAGFSAEAGRSSNARPPSHRYLLNVQADLLDHLSTRTVVPLIRLKDYPKPIKELNPVFEIAAEPHVMLTQAIATIPVRELKRRITSLVSRQDEITRALDILVLGY